jgi:AraC-like DNA-binding protein
MLNMVGEYHVINQPNISISLSPNEQLFNRFYEAIIQHHRESHEMAFYARICCLSPKHFSEVIKRDTGISANKWISTYLTVRAKSLLDSREDYSVQKISDYLGFSEQSSFSRFFKRETGMSPRDYRK